eukprot:CAMPEP_0201219376 /NCGR_PEP_ID=MMETSP0851-20130426/191048_1 /ASSEMBLY_ACC=CAM_ASM_000631 /TAXON_ID=183588 /ORGANISM="Pseudo-nitzschia fraudulenta, Strain WWA7" /LENGTH=198 /DNA_ID=CAMNT_0047509065 /DNA_START=880 /DNA_END=1477 /DNA_ORIENTATION=+
MKGGKIQKDLQNVVCPEHEEEICARFVNSYFPCPKKKQTKDANVSHIQNAGRQEKKYRVEGGYEIVACVPRGGPSGECNGLARNGCFFQCNPEESFFRESVHDIIDVLQKMKGGKIQKDLQNVVCPEHEEEICAQAQNTVDESQQIAEDPLVFGRFRVSFVNQGIVFFVRHVAIDGDEIFLHGDGHGDHQEFDTLDQF